MRPDCVLKKRDFGIDHRSIPTHLPAFIVLSTPDRKIEQFSLEWPQVRQRRVPKPDDHGVQLKSSK